MTMDNFLEVTRMGTALCIVDGYILDITDFIDTHPGGRHLLRYARGSDITEEFCGLAEVDGLRNVHSRAALELMKSLIIASLVDESGDEEVKGHKISSPATASQQPVEQERKSQRRGSVNASSVFRRCSIVALEHLTPKIELTRDAKPVILLRLAVPISRGDKKWEDLATLPSSVFTFRIICGLSGSTVERQYTPVRVHKIPYRDNGDAAGVGKQEILVDFIISLIPGGKMSAVLLDIRTGKSILAKGPVVNPSIIQRFENLAWETIVMVAAGTGIAPMLQVIDRYLSRSASKTDASTKSFPRMLLVWVVSGPGYDYSESLGLEKLIGETRGAFRYTIIYSSSDSKEDQVSLIPNATRTRRSMAAKRRNAHSGWDLQSLADAAGRKLWSVNKAKEKVKGLVVRSSLVVRSGNGSFKRSSTRNNVETSGQATRVAPNDKHHFSSETWLGPTQYRYRDYDKHTVREILASIDSARDAKESELKMDLPQVVEGNDLQTNGGNDLFAADKRGDVVVDGQRNPGAPLLVASEGQSGEERGNGSCDAKSLVVISGAPTFEYQTQVILGELDWPKEQVLTFHGSSALVI
jgi:Cytochrome b5-like Heme/Steroid binding domain